MGTLVNGIKEIFATAKTTGSNVMLCGNDGTPDGHMTMANLASVLGGQTVPYGDYLTGNLDTITTYTRSFANYSIHTVTGLPSALGNNYMCYVMVDCYQIKSGSYDRYVKQTVIDNRTNKIYQRLVYQDGTTLPWNEIAMDVPSFYKNYADLSSLANALGVSALKSSSLFRIISGEVPSNQTVDVSCGNGLLFVGVFSGGTLYWPNYWSTEVQIIAGATNTQYTVTKSAESRVVHITAPSSYSVSYAYIGFTS